MTQKEYFKWKTEHPNEWREVYIETLKNFLKNAFLAGKHSNDVMYVSPNIDKNKRVYTYGRVANALINENDCCDDTVQMQKQFNDYNTSLKGSC